MKLWRIEPAVGEQVALIVTIRGLTVEASLHRDIAADRHWLAFWLNQCRLACHTSYRPNTGVY